MSMTFSPLRMLFSLRERFDEFKRSCEMEELYSIIKRPLITEKSSRQKEAQNQYLFEVDRRANKIDIKKAVERLFRVKVDRVNVSMVHGKVKRLGKNMGKRPDWKKAVVLLKEGDRIDFFEGA